MTIKKISDLFIFILVSLKEKNNHAEDFIFQ